MSWAILWPILLDILRKHFPRKVADRLMNIVPKHDLQGVSDAVLSAPMELKNWLTKQLRSLIEANVKSAVVKMVLFQAVSLISDRMIDEIWNRLFDVNVVGHKQPVLVGDGPKPTMTIPTEFDAEADKEFGKTPHDGNDDTDETQLDGNDK